MVAQYGKATILKYISNKIDFQPNSYVLDEPDEKTIMKEILIEMEQILFSDAKTKILALNASTDPAGDKAKLEGINRILKKYIEELLLHFNLPFGQMGMEPTIEEIVYATVEQFEEIVGKPDRELNLQTYLERFAADCTAKGIPENLASKLDGYISGSLRTFILQKGLSVREKLVRLYLLKNGRAFEIQLKAKLERLNKKLYAINDHETQKTTEDFVFEILHDEVDEILFSILNTKNTKIVQLQLHQEVRSAALFIIELMNKTKTTEYYDKYTIR